MTADEIRARLKIALAQAEHVVSVGKASPDIRDLELAYAEAYGYLHETVRAIVAAPQRYSGPMGNERCTNCGHLKEPDGFVHECCQMCARQRGGRTA